MAEVFGGRAVTALRFLAAHGAIFAATLSLLAVIRLDSWLAWAAVLSAGMLVISGLARWGLRKTRAAWVSLPLALLFAGILILRIAAPSHMFFGIIPTFETWREVGSHLEGAAQVIQTQPPPVPAGAGIVIFALAGVAIVTALVDLLALRAQAPALTAVPLLALWTPTIVLARNISAVIVLISLATWLLLLALEKPWHRMGRSAIIRTLWALTSAAAVFVLVITFGVPTLESWGHWRSVTVSKNPRSLAPITVGRPVVLSEGIQLSHILGERSDETILRYRSAGAKPTILRLRIMSEYAAGDWLPATDLGGSAEFPLALTAEPRGRAASLLEVQHTGLVDRFGISPGNTVGMAKNADSWLLTSDTGELIHASGAITDQYEVVWETPDFTGSDLRAAPEAKNVAPRWTQLPDDLPTGFYDELERAKGDAETPYEIAVSIQDWFRSDGGYSYEVTNDEITGEALEDFFLSRTGFCVHYATAMTLMLRSEGIPTRVAVGFLPGTRTNDGWMEVAANRAHAWPEVYFEDYGWVRFEPTPADQTGQTPAWARQSSTDNQPTNTSEPSEPTASETPSDPEPTATASASPSANTPTSADDSESEGPQLWLFSAGAFLALLAIMGVGIWRFRVRRPPHTVATKWEAARRISASVAPEAVAKSWVNSRSPRQIAAELSAELPPAMARELTALAVEIEDQAFSPERSRSRASVRADAEGVSAVDEHLARLRAASRQKR